MPTVNCVPLALSLLVVCFALPRGCGAGLAAGAPSPGEVVKVNGPSTTAPTSSREGIVSASCEEDGACAVAYIGLSRENRPLLRFVRLRANGTREAEQVLTESNSWFPTLLRGSNGALHLIWIEREARKRYQVVYRGSDDHGDSWSERRILEQGVPATPVLLTEDGAGAIMFALLAQLDRLGQRVRIVSQVSRDSGKTWESVVVQGANPGTASELNMTSVGSGIAVAWQERTESGVSILFNFSGDGGKSWFSAPVQVLPVSRSRIEQLQLRAAGPSILATWVEWTGGHAAIMAGASRDQGKTWQRSVLLDNVRLLTYEAELTEHNVVLVTLERDSKELRHGHRVRCRKAEVDQLWKSDQGGEVQTTEVWSHLYPGPALPEYLSARLEESVVTVARSLKSESPAVMRSFLCGKIAGADDIVRVTPDEGGKEKSLVAIARLPRGVAVFYLKPKSRRLHPYITPPSDLMLRRIELLQ